MKILAHKPDDLHSTNPAKITMPNEHLILRHGHRYCVYISEEDIIFALHRPVPGKLQNVCIYHVISHDTRLLQK
jgi:hypothetical protein